MTTFPFDRLPQEIKDQIYEGAITAIGPRVVELTEHLAEKLDSKGEPFPYPRPSMEAYYTSSCPIPNVLHLCSQSRRLALKRWRLMFGTREQKPRVYFDFSQDTLWFSHTSASFSYYDCFEDQLERPLIQHLAIELRWLEPSGYHNWEGRHLAKSIRTNSQV
ncbi:hypothetical protein B0J14DRAFT_575240 [Halenospora varia]|nr:hypothetical protein B0J14DRAFT_575240 [Halenospora varia]